MYNKKNIKVFNWYLKYAIIQKFRTMRYKDTAML